MIAFPELPSYSANAFYVTWKPMLGSPECITVLIVVIGQDGKASITRALPALKGSSHLVANQLIDVVTRSLASHLNRSLDVNLWTPPFTGFKASKERQYVGLDTVDITKQIAGLNSIFYLEQS